MAATGLVNKRNAPMRKGLNASACLKETQNR